MRLDRIQVRNYRCLRNMDVTLDDYTVLVGANGAGKSALLYALDWFFNGGTLTPEDIFHRDKSNSAISDDDIGELLIEVEVHFTDLNNADRQVLGMYARGEVARFRPSWSPDQGEKIIGNALQGPGFAEVRAQPPPDDMKEAYLLLRENVTDLPPATPMTKIKESLDDWEADPANQSRLVNVDSADATHLFGIAGEHVLARRFRMILVPAAADLASEVGTAGRGSALNQLVGSLTADAVARARSDWENEHRTQIETLNTAITGAISAATAPQESIVNRSFAELVSGGRVAFRGSAPDWTLRGDATIHADVLLDGHRDDGSLTWNQAVVRLHRDTTTASKQKSIELDPAVLTLRLVNHREENLRAGRKPSK